MQIYFYLESLKIAFVQPELQRDDLIQKAKLYSISSVRVQID